MAGLGLLFRASMLFTGLIGFLLLQPLLTAAPFRLADTALIAILSLVAVVPFALFLRAAVSAHVQ